MQPWRRRLDAPTMPCATRTRRPSNSCCGTARRRAMPARLVHTRLHRRTSGTKAHTWDVPTSSPLGNSAGSAASAARNAMQPSSAEARASMAADATQGSLRAASPKQTQWLQHIRWFDFCAHLCLLTMLPPYLVLYVKDYTSGCMQIELAATFTSEKSQPRIQCRDGLLGSGCQGQPVILEGRDIGATVTTRWPSNDSRQR